MKIRFCSLLSFLGAVLVVAALSACDSSDSAGADSNDPATANQGNVVSKNKGSEYDPATGILTDLRDNQIYRTVKIGDQIWMAENLRFEYFKQNEGNPCYGDDPANCEKYGRLYKVYNASVVCPKGWHIPDTTEFGILYDKADAMPERAKSALSSAEGWDDFDGKTGTLHRV